MQRTKIMKVNPTNPELDCRMRTQRRRAYKAEHQQLLKSLFLRKHVHYVVALGNKYYSFFTICLYCSWEEWMDSIIKTLTDIARGPAGCGHHISFTLHLWQSKVTDHDFWLFILAVVKQVLGLERGTSKMGFEYVSPVTTSLGWCIAFNTILS